MAAPSGQGQATRAAGCPGCALLRSELRLAQARIALLEAQLQEFQREVFGRKSEVAEPDSGAAADADAADGDSPPDDPEPPERQKRRRGRQPGSPQPGRVDRSHLPVEREELRPPEEECACPECGTPYVPNGGETSRLYEIDLRALAREIFRQRLQPACDCERARPVIAAPAPRLNGRTQLGTSVWAWFLVQVYAFFRPQAAAARDLAARGLRVPVSTLSAGLRRLQPLFEPLVAAIEARQERAAVVHADETSWPVQDVEAPRGSGRSRHWLWLCLTWDAVRMRILPTRGSPSGFQLLRRIGLAGAATVVCDRWSAYGVLQRILPGAVKLAYCWAHQRRDFRRVATGYPSLRPWAEAWIERIGELFHLAGQRRDAWQPERPPEQQGARFQALQQRLESALEELFRKVRRELKQVAREWLAADAGGTGRALALAEARGRALHSLLTHETGLSLFASDPGVPPDNNAAERALRGPVIGRLTSFGSGSAAGAEFAALLFSVFGTLRLAGLNPYAWTLDYLAACARRGGRAPQRLEPWLPWSLDAARKQALSQAPQAECPTPADAQPAPLARAA